MVGSPWSSRAAERGRAEVSFECFGYSLLDSGKVAPVVAVEELREEAPKGHRFQNVSGYKFEKVMLLPSTLFGTTGNMKEKTPSSSETFEWQWKLTFVSLSAVGFASIAMRAKQF